MNQILRVGADRCVRPNVSVWNHLQFLPFVDAYAALAGRVHRVSADAAGRYKTTVVWTGSACMLPLIETNPPRRGGPLCPPACNEFDGPSGRWIRHFRDSSFPYKP
jgi:hypothetical protein